MARAGADPSRDGIDGSVAATMGVVKEETVHVGMGQFTDLKVCHELGIRSVWIDRVGETLNPDWPPDAFLPDLTGLPGLLSPA